MFVKSTRTDTEANVTTETDSLKIREFRLPTHGLKVSVDGYGIFRQLFWISKQDDETIWISCVVSLSE